MEILNYLAENWLWMGIYMVAAWVGTFISWLLFALFSGAGATSKNSPSIFTFLFLTLLSVVSAIICGLLALVFKFAFIIGLLVAIINYIKQ